ncbi:MAG: AlpA family phage regulatory protein [Gammaproteobacteria bacterium]|nr:AlpA family phage regulatory protein [Gammaproteobacteria bacterium]MBU1442798.1 AlpA family phage regulatory protein [Gammaproteobacteria bacterium]MBU2286943.1 AlpA family phage regulatory protein [Gammaproteobacteria bacterium]MBU2408842.1 AlpA family phage regulatory protein [Gammaproteobacteria bacterium]
MGVSRSHFYALVAAGRFPKASVRLSAKCVRWRAGNVTAWLDAQGAA